MNEIPAALGLTAEQVTDLLATAGRAPSLHNTQPWRFRVSPTVIELHADPGRGLPAVDPTGAELRLACGAALYNLRLALHGRGIRPIVTVLPDPDRPGLFAAIRNGGVKPPTPEQLRLLRAVPRRHTNRHPFSADPVTAAEQHALRRAALDEGAWLHVVDDRDERATLQQLAAEAHQLQMADPAFRAELEQWTAVTPGRRDGVPATAGGPHPSPQDRWVRRDFTGGTAPERVPGKNFEDNPMIAVLTSHLAGADADLRAGQAMQRVLLTATADGLATSFLSQLVEVPPIREKLRRLIGGTRPPHVVLRVGRGWPVPATPRREPADLLAHDVAATVQPSP